MKKRTNNKRIQANGKAEQAAAPPGWAAPTPVQIQKRAYEIYEARGREPGHELDDWLLAQYELTTEIELQGRDPAQ